MKTLVAAAVILASVSAVHAKECTYTNDTGISIKAVHKGMRITTPDWSNVFWISMPTKKDFILVNGAVPSDKADGYLAAYDTDGNIVSSRLATQLTGGSATFIRKCK